MTSYKARGNKHNVIYTYKTAEGKHKSHWETYLTALEAIQRKSFIDHLQQKNNTMRSVMLTIKEAQIIDFNTLLAAYYESGEGAALKTFLYENAIDGITFERSHER